MSVSEALQVTSLKGRAATFQHLATRDIYDLLGRTNFIILGKKQLFSTLFSPLLPLKVLILFSFRFIGSVKPLTAVICSSRLFACLIFVVLFLVYFKTTDIFLFYNITSDVLSYAYQLLFCITFTLETFLCRCLSVPSDD